MKKIFTLICSLVWLQLAIGQSWDQIIKTAASDRNQLVSSRRYENDAFGHSVAISGNYAVVGVPNDDYNNDNLVQVNQAGSALVFKYNSTSGKWEQLKKLLPNSRKQDDKFGISVAISGSLIVVGAWADDEDASELNTIDAAGAAYVFSKDEGGTDNWGLVKKIVASDRAAYDAFGSSVAIDGSTIAIGAPWVDYGLSYPDAGAVYVFTQNQGGTNNWGQVKKITTSDYRNGDRFGTSVAISGTIIIGGAYLQDYDAAGNNFATDAGAAYVFSKDQGGTNNWGQVKKIVGSDRSQVILFGYSVSISGNNAVVGTSGMNASGAYLFNKDQGGTNNWGLVKKIVPSDYANGEYYGFSVSISGSTVVVGAPQDDHDADGLNTLDSTGSVYVFSQNQGGTNNWGQVKKVVAADREKGDMFGFSVAVNGTNLLVGAPSENHDANGENYTENAGSAYVLTQNSGGTSNWGQLQKLDLKKINAAQYGISVAIDGDFAVVGAFNDDRAPNQTDVRYTGAAYVLQKISGTWTEIKKLVANVRSFNDRFGTSVAISGNTIVIGAPLEAEDENEANTLTYAGAAYVFSKNQGGINNWGLVKKIVPADRGLYDNFGNVVAVSGSTIVVGVKDEDEDAAGANTLSAAGSAYVFSKDQGGTDNWGQLKKLLAPIREAGDEFGVSVAIYDSTIVVGSHKEDHDAAEATRYYEAGSAYIFNRNKGGADNWGFAKKIVASDRSPGSEFGYTVAIYKSTVVVGTINQSSSALGTAPFIGGSGGAYIYSQNQGGTNQWGQIKKLVVADRNYADHFGNAVAISGNTVVVAALDEDEDETGANTLASAGAVYIYSKDQGGTNAWGLVAKKVHSDRAALDYYGNAVAIYEGTILVGAPSNATDGSLAKNQFQAGSAYFYYNPIVLLPVQWGRFTAQQQQQKTLLQWSTLSEQNTRHFEVQHSTDGRNWKYIGLVYAAGNSQSEKKYAYTHTTPAVGLNFYRLVQSDLDGKTTISEVKQLAFTTQPKLNIYPNPVSNGVLQVELPSSGMVQLYSAEGKLLLSQYLNAGAQQINIRQLTPGQYSLRQGVNSSTFVVQ